MTNGVPVFQIDLGAQEVFQAEFVFYAGNCFENKTGIAAATNFLLKAGTNTRSAFEINEAFEYYGAQCSRACYNETSVVNVHGLSAHTGKLFPVLRDMLTDAIFPAEELSIYVSNAGQALAVNMKKCEFVASRMIDEMLYGKDHPYARFNNEASLDALSRDDVIDFYNQYYQQGRLAIFVSGKLPQDIRAQLEASFGDLPFTAPDFETALPSFSPAAEKFLRHTNDAQAVQGAVRIAQPFPSRHHPDFQGVIVLNSIFGGYFGSRLMSNIREEKGYTYGIHSYLQNHIGEGAWMISTEAGKDVCEATVSETFKEMDILRDELIDEEELETVKNYMIGTILGDLDGPFQVMAKWKNIILNKLDERYFYDSVNTIKSITAEQLQALARKYLVKERFYDLIVY